MHIICIQTCLCMGFPGGSDSKESACNTGDTGLIPGSGRSPGEGDGNPLQYSSLGNPMDRGTWRATVGGVANSQTRPSNKDFHTFIFKRKMCQVFIFLLMPSLQSRKASCISIHGVQQHTLHNERIAQALLQKEMVQHSSFDQTQLRFSKSSISTALTRFQSHGKEIKHMPREVGGSSKREGTYYLRLIHVWQKLTQYCKVIILPLKRKK